MKIRFVILISILSLAFMSGCGFNTPEEDKEQKEFDKRMDELDKSIKENQASIDELGKSIEKKAEYIESIGSDNEKENPEDDEKEVPVFDFSYQDFIEGLTANLEGLGVSISETKYMGSITFITLLTQDNSTVTVKVLSNDLEKVSCIIVPLDIVSNEMLTAIAEVVDDTVFVTEDDISSGYYEVNGILFLTNDHSLSIMPDE